jgi:hypothetical protein
VSWNFSRLCFFVCFFLRLLLSSGLWSREEERERERERSGESTPHTSSRESTRGGGGGVFSLFFSPSNLSSVFFPRAGKKEETIVTFSPLLFSLSFFIRMSKSPKLPLAGKRAVPVAKRVKISELNGNGGDSCQILCKVGGGERVLRALASELAHFLLPPRERLANSLAPPLTPQAHPPQVMLLGCSSSPGLFRWGMKVC